jgi:hypothetical protein
MANTITTNPDITSRYSANVAIQQTGLANLATYAGDTANSAPTLDTDGTPFYGFTTAVVPFKVTNPGGANTIIIYVYAMYRFADGSICWVQITFDSTTTTSATTCAMHGAERIAARMEVDGGTPEFAIDFNAL